MNLSSFVSITSLLLWAAAFLYIRSYLKRRTGADRLLAEFREEVEKLVSEIDAATDRDATLVEDRVKSLRALLEEADRRIAAHGRELDRRLSEERAYAELGRRAAPSRGPASGVPGRAETPPAVAAPVSATPREPPVEAAVPAGGEADGGEPRKQDGPRFVRAPTPIEPKAAPFAERVAELHRAGFSADLIAKRLGATVAEVDLAIALAGRIE